MRVPSVNRLMKVTRIEACEEELELFKHQDEKVCLRVRSLLFLINILH